MVLFLVPWGLAAKVLGASPVFLLRLNCSYAWEYSKNPRTTDLSQKDLNIKAHEPNKLMGFSWLRTGTPLGFRLFIYICYKSFKQNHESIKQKNDNKRFNQPCTRISKKSAPFSNICLCENRRIPTKIRE